VQLPGKATVFPQTIGLAASFDPDGVYRMAVAISDEFRAKHNEFKGNPPGSYSGCLTAWSPTLNLARDPRWGRTQETYGEDPYLTGRMGVAYVKGLQGDDPKYIKVVACIKHFAGNNQETKRFSSNAVADERYWFEYEFRPFEACVKEAHVEHVMTAYNGINGVPCSGNKWLLADVLRGRWGFKGYVTTDCGAMSNMVDQHHYVKTPGEAIAAALDAGVDMECGWFSAYPDIANNYLEGAVKQGLVSEAVVDRAVARILAARFKLGMFDPPDRVPYSKIVPNVVACPKHMALSRQLAKESMVLLKNSPVGGEPLLPFNAAKVRTIAVVGPRAAECQLGDYTAEEPAGPLVTPFMGIQARAGEKINVKYAPWGDGDPTWGPAADNMALRAAKEADVVVAVLGLDSKVAMEGRDLTTLALPKDQEAFIEKMVAANPRTVVVLINGHPLAINWIKEHVPAILEAWYPGTQGGHAIADVLFGDYNPAGRLPVTFYASDAQLRPFNEYDLTKGRTYMYFAGEPLYPFGWGLSYTNFKYNNLRVSNRNVHSNDTLRVSVDVANAGSRDGDEVVEVYVHQQKCSVKQPIKQLKAFERIHLKKGQRQTVTLPLAVRDWAYWDVNTHAFVVEPGVFDVMVGASSADTNPKTEVRVQ
jgi:beta-glucosidase